MFRLNYVGTAPYLTCIPSVYHHKLSRRDRLLILSSDGLYQYFTNEEAVSEVELFISSFPEGDPAQHLIEEVLFRAAKKAGKLFFLSEQVLKMLLFYETIKLNVSIGVLQEWPSMSCLTFHRGNAGGTMMTFRSLLYPWREEYGDHRCK